MLPVSYFAPVHKPGRAASQPQPALIHPGAKRKGDDDGHDWGDTLKGKLLGKGQALEGDISSLIPTPQPVTPAQGLDDQDGLEQDADGSNTSPRDVTTDNSLAHLQPPLLHAGRSSPIYSAIGARQRHLAVLTAIMHRSLLQNDCVRASRAWAMILRSERRGHSVDLRSSSRWGLGAEFLLRQGLHEASNDLEHRYSNDGFEQAKQYYERLSLQYPYYKVYPDATGSLDFLLAMFSLWILSCILQRSRNTDGHQTLQPHTSTTEASFEPTDDLPRETLRQTCDIMDKLDELLASPIYSDSGKYQELRHMVVQWKNDLAMNPQYEGFDPDGSITQGSESATDSSVGDA